MRPLALILDSSLVTLLALGGSCDTCVEDSSHPCGNGTHWDGSACVPGGAATDHEGITMVLIPSGTFTMGSPPDEVGRGPNETEHQVTLTRSFWMSVYEVTQAEFEGFMGYQPSYFGACSDCPVENTDWSEAANFANAVSDAAGLARCYACSGSGDSVSCDLDSAYATPYDCEGYRLPTEAEWEYAARAGATSAFNNGGNLYSMHDTLDCGGSLLLDNGAFLDAIAIYCGNDPSRTEEVGTKKPNRWGLYDVHGNVWEWCHDWHDDYGGTATDPWGPNSGSYRAGRGSSWDGSPVYLRSAEREPIDPTFGSGGLGLRLARSE